MGHARMFDLRRRALRHVLRRARAGITAVRAGVLATVMAAGVPAAVFASPGDLDAGFGGARHGGVVFDMGLLTGTAVQPNGGIVTVGYTDAAANVDAVAARFHADGTRDSRFGTVKLPPGPVDGIETARAAVAQPDGKVVVVGSVNDNSGLNDVGVWRIMPSGHPDTSFGGDGFVEIGTATTSEAAFAVALDPKGRILVAGVRVTGTDADVAVARLTPGGGLDPGFNQGTVFVVAHPGLDVARAVTVESGGEMVVAGAFAGVSGNAVLRVTPGGSSAPASVDTITGVPGTLATDRTDVAVTGDGHILVLDGVPSATTPGERDTTVVRLTSTGVVDPTFGSSTGAAIDIPGTTTVPGALTVLPRGGVAVVGSTNDHTTFVAKLHNTGSPADAMGPGGVRTLPVGGDLADVAALTDGRIIAAGNAGTKNVVLRLLGDLKPPSCGGEQATIVGTKTADKLVGTSRPDVIAGLGGGDTITGLGKGDVICGGHGNDTLKGGAGRDTLYGQTGRDKLLGGPGHDELRGGPGHDIIKQ
jgi:uncharacterized delta-60 repeat protein